MAQALDGQRFDVIIVGTGLSQSILAAALSLAGKSVLHIDKNGFYGGNEASFTLDQFVSEVEDGEVGRIGEWMVTRVDPLSDEVKEHSRRILVDLRNRLLFCRGSFVDALVQGDVAKYLSFQTVSETIALYRGGDAEEVQALSVPCSKSEVFKSKKFKVVEKRQLMKFLQFCMDRTVQESSGGDPSAVAWRNETHLNQGRSLARPQNKSVIDADTDASEAEGLAEFLKRKFKMTEKLRDLIGYAVAFMQSKDEMNSITLERALPAIGRYLNGLGRFGKTAFICPVYGISECNQAFCRAAAVHGATYVLREDMEEVLIEETKDGRVFKGVRLSGNATVYSGAVVREAVIKELKGKEPLEREQRRVLIVDAPVLSLCSGTEESLLKDMLKDSFLVRRDIGGSCSAATNANGRAFMVIPPGTFNNKKVVQVVQLDRVAEAVPSGIYVVSLTSVDARGEDFDQVVDYLVTYAKSRIRELLPDPETTLNEQEGPKVLWQADFHRSLPSAGATNRTPVEGVLEFEEVVSMDCFRYCAQARAAFEKLVPGVEFLAKAEEFSSTKPPAREDEYLSTMLQSAPVPQLVDLTWFEFLGGKLIKQ